MSRRRRPGTGDAGGAAGSMSSMDKPLAMPVDVLKPDPINPREIDERALGGLRISMNTFGDLSGITWNERTAELVCGHQRMTGLMEEGAAQWTRTSKTEGFILHPRTSERFGIRIVDWDMTTQRMANLVANNPAIQGAFTPDAVEQLRELEGELHFAELGLDALQAQLEKDLADALEDADNEGGDGDGSDGSLLELANFTIADPRTKIERGQVWRLGRHWLFCVSVVDGWRHYVPKLTGDALLIPFPSPIAAVAERGEQQTLVFVHHDTYIAGHLVDRYIDAHGPNDVRHVETVAS